MTCCGAVQTGLDFIVYRSGRDFPQVFDVQSCRGLGLVCGLRELLV